jgi:hypothetical protein
MELFDVLDTEPAQNTKLVPFEKDICGKIYVIYVQGGYG